MINQMDRTFSHRLLLAAALSLVLALLLGVPPLHSHAPASPLAADARQPAFYQQWRAEQPPPPPLHVERVYASPARQTEASTSPVVCALVHPDLYPGLAASLARWAADLEREGWSVQIDSVTFPDPPALRAHLAAIADLRGCLLVGDMPIPWFKWTTKEFPFDLYYMDLDGVWHDDDGDGLYEEHTGDILPEIWIGRLTAGNLTFGRDELALVQNYFAKNHAYRTGELQLPARALVYVDDPWVPGGSVPLSQAMPLLYPDTMVVDDQETTRADDYGRRLNDYYAWIHLVAHSTFYGHFLLYDQEGRTSVIYNENIYDLDPHAFFYNFFACGVARYTEPDYIAGWYLFSDTYGLAAIGSTSGGGMARDWHFFYQALAQAEPLGAAYLTWFEETWKHIPDQSFHYGITLLGDPTLTVDTVDPSGEPPAALTLAGPTHIGVGRTGTFTAAVSPATATPPLFYTWHVTDKAPTTHKSDVQDSASLAWWTAPGIKTIAVTATNPFGAVTATHTLTVQAPDVEPAPRAFSETLVLGTTLTRTLTLANAGPGELAFSLAEAVQGLTAGVGPDPFGYTYLDSTQPNGPAYRWIEIAPPAGGSGAEIETLTGASTGYAYPVSLPFTFNYYGTDYKTLAVHSDGVLSWSNRPANMRNLPLPSAREYEIVRFLAPFWDDLTIDPGAVYAQDLGSAFVIEYHQVSRQGYPADPGSWEIILYDTGNILFQYADVDLGGTAADNGQSATIGIQGDALTGLQYAYNAPALSDGLAICFAYPGQLPDCSEPLDLPWLSVSLAGSTVAPGTRRTVDLILDARAPHVAGPGVYSAALIALTNDPQYRLLNVPVAMTVVSPTYGLALAPRTAARSGRPGESLTYTLHLTNTGTAPDAYKIDLTADWPAAAPSEIGPLAPDRGARFYVTVSIPADAAPGATGQTTVRVTSRGAPTVHASAALTTTALLPLAPPYTYFLPLLLDTRSSAFNK